MKQRRSQFRTMRRQRPPTNQNSPKLQIIDRCDRKFRLRSSQPNLPCVVDEIGFRFESELAHRAALLRADRFSAALQARRDFMDRQALHIKLEDFPFSCAQHTCSKLQRRISRFYREASLFRQINAASNSSLDCIDQVRAASRLSTIPLTPMWRRPVSMCAWQIIVSTTRRGCGRARNRRRRNGTALLPP